MDRDGDIDVTWDDDLLSTRPLLRDTVRCFAEVRAALLLTERSTQLAIRSEVNRFKKVKDDLASVTESLNAANNSDRELENAVRQSKSEIGTLQTDAVRRRRQMDKQQEEIKRLEATISDLREQLKDEQAYSGKLEERGFGPKGIRADIPDEEELPPPDTEDAPDGGEEFDEALRLAAEMQKSGKKRRRKVKKDTVEDDEDEDEDIPPPRARSPARKALKPKEASKSKAKEDSGSKVVRVDDRRTERGVLDEEKTSAKPKAKEEMPKAKGPRGSICILHIMGKCRRAESCLGVHVGKEEGDKMLSVLKKKACRQGAKCTRADCVFTHPPERKNPQPEEDDDEEVAVVPKKSEPEPKTKRREEKDDADDKRSPERGDDRDDRRSEDARSGGRSDDDAADKEKESPAKSKSPARSPEKSPARSADRSPRKSRDRSPSARKSKSKSRDRSRQPSAKSDRSAKASEPPRKDSPARSRSRSSRSKRSRSPVRRSRSPVQRRIPDEGRGKSPGRRSRSASPVLRRPKRDGDAPPLARVKKGDKGKGKGEPLAGGKGKRGDVRMCIAYIMGGCKNGDDCADMHVAKEDSSRLLDSLKKKPCRDGDKCQRPDCIFRHDGERRVPQENDDGARKVILERSPLLRRKPVAGGSGREKSESPRRSPARRSAERSRSRGDKDKEDEKANGGAEAVDEEPPADGGKEPVD